MESLGEWVLPMSFLPGVGLLILSTSTRYMNLSDRLRDVRSVPTGSAASRELRCMWLFRNALVGLYLAVACFSLATLASGLVSAAAMSATVVLRALTTLGVLAVVYAAGQLLWESILTLRLVENCDREE